MRRATAAAVLLFFFAAAHAPAACVSLVRDIPSPAGTTGLIPGPVAWTGTSLAATGVSGSAKTIWLSIFSETGDLLGPQTAVVSSSSSGPLGLFWTGTELGLFYVAGGSLYLQRFTASGAFIGGPIAIAISQSVRLSDEFAVAWSQGLDAYVIGRSMTSGSFRTWATIVERDGTIREDERLNIQGDFRGMVRVAASEAEFAGLFYERDETRDLMYARIDSGTFSHIARVTDAVEDLLVAARGDEFILVTTATTIDGNAEIRWMRIDSEGEVVSADSSLFVAPGAYAKPIALVSAGDEIALTYAEADDESSTQDYRLRRMRDDGSLITDTLFATAAKSNRRSITTSNFVWTGESYLSWTARQLTSRIDNHFLRYCPLEVRIVTSSRARAGQLVTFTAEVEGGLPSYSYDWRFGDRNSDDDAVSFHAYSQPGTYVVTLTVTDTDGVVQTATATVVVGEGKRRAVRS